MPVCFPGMNPYLEHPDLWPEVHRRLVSSLANLIRYQLSDRYEIAVRQRVYRVTGEDALVVGMPETGPRARPGGNLALSPRQPTPITVYVPVPQEVTEDYLEIVEPQAGEVVTIVEFLSPKKKRFGRGRLIYEQHREAILGSPAHFVEIDLLRGWEPTAMYGPDEDSDYRILISRRETRPRAELYTWKVTDQIPLFSLPLRHPEEEPIVDLKLALDNAHERSGYDMVIDYHRNPLPPLRADQTPWLEEHLKQLKLR